MTNTSRPLPKLKDLHRSPEEAFKNDELKLLLNQPPHADWIKKNKYAKNAEYLPIDKTEFLLDYIFQEWRVEILKVEAIFNAVLALVRLHYKNPVTGEWSYHDGGAAKTLQTMSESGPLKLDLSNVNQAACEMAVPIAISTAIKDAADHLGKLFGRDLNRKDTIPFYGAHNQEEPGSQTPAPAVSAPAAATPVIASPAPAANPAPTNGFNASDL